MSECLMFQVAATTPRSVAFGRGLALILTLCPVAAFAQWTAIPHAGVDVEYNSNVYDLPSILPETIGKNGPSLGDTALITRAGLDASFQTGQQKFYFLGEFRRYDFNEFTLLDHNEQTFDLGLNWKLQRLLDGKLDYDHEQRMVQFQDLGAATTSLILETENRSTASVNVNVTPEWRVESRGIDRTLDSPRVDVPGLGLHEDSVREGLRYIGLANLSAGIDAEYLTGTYRDDPLALNPNYHQLSEFLAANYAVSGFTNFIGGLGETKRTDPTNSGGLTAFTGNIGYQHQVTGKTSLNLQITRAINSYITTAGNELDTSAGLNLTWQATYRLAVKVGYTATESKFPVAPIENGYSSRLDHLQLASAEFDYQLLRWLTLRAYGHYQTRHSDQELYTFNASVYGVELLAKPTPRN